MSDKSVFYLLHYNILETDVYRCHSANLNGSSQCEAWPKVKAFSLVSDYILRMGGIFFYGKAR